ncbi:MAG: hypothetical protein IKK50_03225 [Ruminiclostridium sp.]|nr:hypothetical protein [Ruminiclostridium sp.]
MYHLQTRWKLEDQGLYYYGLRNKKQMFKNLVKISRKQREIIGTLPCSLTEAQKAVLGSLLGVQVVTEDQLRPLPRSLREARFCTDCCANDFILPGLEFDDQGRCPLCQTAEETRDLRSILPIVVEIPPTPEAPFDCALFYTGGKDSTFLLYYLSKVKGLRVLALTWEIPFLSDSARASIQGAKEVFPDVTFRGERLPDETLRRFYRKLYALSENTCACPSLAYVLFYPLMVELEVPCFLAGNEPVQMLGLYYNRMAPRLAYRFGQSKVLPALMNLGRVLTLRPPLKQGQFQTLMTMKQLAYGDHPVKRLSGYESELVSNIVAAMEEVPELLPPLREAICRSDRTGKVPAFVHLDFDAIAGGNYDWNKVKDILAAECGWVPPAAGQKALHTSCFIEKCKDHTQFLRFYHCRSKMIPFSALEMALASGRTGRSREEMMEEMEDHLGLTLDPPLECAIMTGYLDEDA